MFFFQLFLTWVYVVYPRPRVYENRVCGVQATKFRAPLVVQVYTQALHRREFEVGYTHRRERALKEGEDASIELARQMESQVRWEYECRRVDGGWRAWDGLCRSAGGNEGVVCACFVFYGLR